jgi:hypothetical protein
MHKSRLPALGPRPFPDVEQREPSLGEELSIAVLTLTSHHPACSRHREHKSFASQKATKRSESTSIRPKPLQTRSNSIHDQKAIAMRQHTDVRFLSQLLQDFAIIHLFEQ